MSAAPLGASRSPAVPTAAIASTCLRRASSTMPAIACAVRRIGLVAEPPGPV